MEARLGEYCQNDKNRNMPRSLRIIIPQVQNIKITFQSHTDSQIEYLLNITV